MNFPRLSGSFSKKKDDGRSVSSSSYYNNNAGSGGIGGGGGIGSIGGGSGTIREEDSIILELMTLPVTMQGLVWKRREGMGKHFAKVVSSSMKNEAWEWRAMELRGNKLVYYYSEQEKQQYEQKQSQQRRNWLDQAKTTMGVSSSDVYKPRGIFDLKEEKAAIHASFGHSGAPSPFCLSIQVTTVTGATETKYKFAFESYSEQMAWLMAMTQVAVQASVDTYNVQLLQAVSIQTVNAETDVLFEHQPSVREPPRRPGDDSSSCGHRLWMMDRFDFNFFMSAQRGADQTDNLISSNAIDHSRRSIGSSNNLQGNVSSRSLASGSQDSDDYAHKQLLEAKDQLKALTQKLQLKTDELDLSISQIESLRRELDNMKVSKQSEESSLQESKESQEQLRQELEAATQKAQFLQTELSKTQDKHSNAVKEADDLRTKLFESASSSSSTAETVQKLQAELKTMQESHDKRMQVLAEEHKVALEQQRVEAENSTRMAVASKEKANAKAIKSATAGIATAVEAIKMEFQTKIDGLVMENKHLAEKLDKATRERKKVSKHAESDGEEDDFEDCVDEFQDCH